MVPDVRILAPAVVELLAGEEVVLRNGVTVEQGAELRVTIGVVPPKVCQVP